MSSASKQLEEDYNKRIDADVDKFVESYGRIVAASKVFLFCLFGNDS